MSEKYSGNQSTFDRLRHSKKAKVTAAFAGLLILAGCSSAKATGGGGPTATAKGKAPATASRTPGTKAAAATTAPSSVNSAPTTSEASRANWCSATAEIIEEAFVVPSANTSCEVMPTSSTPGDVLIKFTLNDAAGVYNMPVELSVINSPFAQFTGAAKPQSGGGTEYVVIPNSSMMYVKVPGNANVTGEVEVLTGDGGAMPLGLQNMLPLTAGAFAVFGSDTIDQLYPAGSQ